MFEDWKRERLIRRTLRKLARQRVAMILPGGALFIEKALMSDEDMDAALRTCHIRGWVEILENAVNHHDVINNAELSLPPQKHGSIKPFYRLTEGGWNAINRTHGWIVSTWLISLLALIVGIMGVLIK